jgi:GMP synthase-like glutamine amidotransferase
VIGEGGVKVSGGERQRLSIARALLRRPHLLVFDEATSSLDSITEEEISLTIREVDRARDAITILIAHRLSTIMHADRIYVLERGRIVEQGGHDELLAQRGLYYAMWRQQVGERRRAVAAPAGVPPSVAARRRTRSGPVTAVRAHYLQHVPFESPGSILPWLAQRGAMVASTRLFEPHALPLVEDFDLLVVMGGPMSVNDEAAHPWLIAEKALVRESIEKGRAVVGVCLGAQVIASALGCRVYRNAAREIGWFPVTAVPAPGRSRCVGRRSSPSSTGTARRSTFHPRRVRLASSEGCLNQAFQIGDRVVGLQFHLEATPATVAAMVEHCRHELTPDRYVQSEQDLLAAPPERYCARTGSWTTC